MAWCEAGTNEPEMTRQHVQVGEGDIEEAVATFVKDLGDLDLCVVAEVWEVQAGQTGANILDNTLADLRTNDE